MRHPSHYIRKAIRKAKPGVSSMTIHGGTRNRNSHTPFIRNLLHRVLRFVGLAGVLAISVLPAHSVGTTINYPSIQIKDEGAAQGAINALDCVGSGITCTRSGNTGTLSVTGGGPGGADFGPSTATLSVSTAAIRADLVLTGGATDTLRADVKATTDTLRADLNTLRTDVKTTTDTLRTDLTNGLAGKQGTGNYITGLTGPVTASGPGSVASTIVGPIALTAISLGTVTTRFDDVAVATKAFVAWQSTMTYWQTASALSTTTIVTNSAAQQVAVGLSTQTLATNAASQQVAVGLSTQTLQTSKQASFTGANIGPCGASQYAGGATYANGVLTGGTCTDDTGGAGGGGNFTSATTDFEFPTGFEGDTSSVTLTGLTWVGANSIIVCHSDGATNSDHDPEDPMLEGIVSYAANLVVGVGFDILTLAPSGTWGRYLINCTGK